jgi:hypothetical protein
MELQLLRYSSQSKTTFGAVSIEKKFQCHSVEDRHRETKIKHETRIPAGRYEIKLREFGGHYERYKQKYEGHEGMLWLQDVPGFSDILIHIGNGEKDTSGCILLCNEVNNNLTNRGVGTNSTQAYLNFYFKVIKPLKSGKKVFISVIDFDEPYND